MYHVLRDLKIRPTRTNLFKLTTLFSQRRSPMRRTILASMAITLAMLTTQANAGLFFFKSSNDCGKPAPKCCAPAPVQKCCAPAPTCCGERKSLLSGIKLPKLQLPKLNLFNRSSNCCQPAPPTCSGGSSAGKVEDVPPPPPYEDKAPAPPEEKPAAAPAPPAAAPAPAPEKKA